MWAFRFIITVLLISFVTLDVEENDAKDFLEQTHGKIIHASVLFRHGERSPTNMYPSDTYPASLWPEGLGQLTKAGKQRLYDVGKWFRERYIDMGLSQGYRYDTLLMNSSDYDRTIMCAEVFLAGLLPPNKNETWADDGLKWQPIPVHVTPLAQDTVIAQVTSCERYDLEKYNANQSPELQAYYKENEEFLEYLSVQSGYNISTSTDILYTLTELAHVYSSFKIEKEHNLILPTWADSVYPEPITSMYNMFLISLAFTPEMRRLQAGPTLGSMISDMQEKQSGSFNQTFHFYSGHDTTIVNLLRTLGIYDNKPPPYGASVIIELRRKDTDYIVTILYRNVTGVRPYLLTLPECGKVCTLDKFIEVTKQWIPDSHEEECQVGLLEKLFTYSKTLMTILICILLLLIFGALAFFILLWVRAASSAHEYNSL